MTGAIVETPAAPLVTRLVTRDRGALARAISLIETGGPAARSLSAAVAARAGRAVVVGFTGPPGAGKSSVIAAYITELRRRGSTVAVAAVDPSSPLSGGAVLGDRIRMAGHTEDPGVFIRSLSSRGHLGGLSAPIQGVIDAMDAAGHDVVLVEAVGAGQSEVEIVEVADIRVVVNAPGLGDDIQAIKAGILEIADILVVNKADLPGAERTARQLRGMLALREAARQDVLVIETAAIDGRGVAALCEAIEQRHALAVGGGRAARRRARAGRLIAQAVARLAEQALRPEQDPALAAVVDAVAHGRTDAEAAALHVLRIMAAAAA